MPEGFYVSKQERANLNSTMSLSLVMELVENHIWIMVECVELAYT